MLDLSKPRPNQTDSNSHQTPSLQSLELDQELLQQYNKAKAILASVEYDPDVPPNQKAQILNTITAVIQAISKTRTDLYNAERLKRLEQALVKSLKKHPQLLEQFLLDYEGELDV